MGTYLITGCAGFIGSHTAEAFLTSGHTVVGVDNLRTGKPANLADVGDNPRFSWVHADITAPGELAAQLARQRVDAIVHLAALVSVAEAEREPALNFQLNVAATQIVADAAKAARVPRVVFASSAAVYGDPPSLPSSENSLPRPLGLYGAAKLASEHLLTASASAAGFSAICLRYFNIFGPRQDPASPYAGVMSIFAARAAAGLGYTIFGSGAQTRDFLSVRDVARANVLAATAPASVCGTFNICTGRQISLRELSDLVREIHPQCPPPTLGSPRPADIQHSCGDPVRARETLDFVAQDSVAALRAYLREIAASEPCRR